MSNEIIYQNRSAEQIALAVDPKARFSNGQWRAVCPVHQGDSQNFYIKDRDGLPLLHCFRGCTSGELIAELRSRGLWPEKGKQLKRQGLTPDEVEYMHLWVAIYDADTGKGIQPTPDQQQKHTRYTRALRRVSNA